MMNVRPATQVFNTGDEVVVTRGTYQSSEGSHGVFLRLREDANWADVTARDGTISSHPVEWLAHSHDAEQVPASGQMAPALRHDDGAVMRRDTIE